MERVDNRIIKVRFNADLAASMRWNFKPQQYEIKVAPGETALAFYTARNPTDRPVIGISTYNVVPFEAGAYFNKIQCFCFEEQQLNPNEEVHPPYLSFLSIALIFSYLPLVFISRSICQFSSILIQISLKIPNWSMWTQLPFRTPSLRPRRALNYSFPPTLGHRTRPYSFRSNSKGLRLEGSLSTSPTVN